MQIDRFSNQRDHLRPGFSGGHTAGQVWNVRTPTGTALLNDHEIELLFRPRQSDFNVVITGFHTYRDLRVRVKAIDAVSP